MDKATAIAKDDEIIDYAFPTMMAEKSLRQLHQAALAKRWYDAREYALLTIKWATEAHAALLMMQEKDKA